MHGFDVGDLERRLVRAESSAAAIPWADRKVARHRASLRVRVSLCDLIRQRLQAMGIDPKCAIALRLGERAAAELAGIPDTPELRASDAAPPTGPVLRRQKIDWIEKLPGSPTAWWSGLVAARSRFCKCLARRVTRIRDGFRSGRPDGMRYFRR